MIHDIRYWRGGSWEERVAADRELERCVADTGAAKESKVMYAGVRVGGGAFWPTPYCWGYGWKSRRGYSSLSAEEQTEVAEVWMVQTGGLRTLPPFLKDEDRLEPGELSVELTGRVRDSVDVGQDP